MPFANLSRIATSQEGPYVAPLSPQNIEELRVNEQEMTQSDGDHNNTAVCSKNGVNANGEARDGFRRQPRVMRKQFYGALAPICLLILAVFWIDMSQVYGLFYNQGKWTSKGHVAVVDFDGGFFGSSLLEAASRVNRSYGYPTYVILSPDSNSPEAIRHEVFVGKYWAALYAFPGSTERFEMAVNSTASEPYEAAQSLAYITLTARYFAFYQFNILSTSIAVTQMASGLISERAIASTLSSRSPDNSALGENAALGHPAQPTEIPAAYADFNLANDKVFVNTIGTVMPVLMQFFFIMAWNGISNHMHVFATKGLKDHLKYRFIGSTIWPLITSLNSTGWTFTFMKSYPTNSGQFFAIWAISWLYEMITFFLLDIITAYVPIEFVPLLMVTYVTWSVAASLGPPGLLNPWYRVNYAFPSSNWYEVSITIYTRGGVNRLFYNLPIMFAWWCVLLVGSMFATRRRVRLGREAFAKGTIVQ